MADVLHELTRQEARQVVLRATMLDARRPTDLLRLIDHLTALPVEPTAAIAPSYDLVPWSRMGSSYEAVDLVDLLEQREVYDDGDGIRPMADLRLHLAEMERYPPWDRTRDWLDANELFRNEVLDALDADGPLASREVHATAQVPFTSSGWNTDRNVRMMLSVLLGQGEVAINGRDGSHRTYDLAERVYPAGVEPVPLADAREIKDERRLRGLGIARAKGTVLPGEPIHVGEAGEPAVVEGIRGEWRGGPGPPPPPLLGRPPPPSALRPAVGGPHRAAG